MLANIEIFK